MFIKISPNWAFSSSSLLSLWVAAWPPCCTLPFGFTCPAPFFNEWFFLFSSPPPSPGRALTLYEAVRRLFGKGKTLDQWRGQKERCARHSPCLMSAQPGGAQRRLFFLLCFVTSASHYPLKGNGSSNYKRTIPRLKTSLFPVL